MRACGNRDTLAAKSFVLAQSRTKSNSLTRPIRPNMRPTTMRVMTLAFVAAVALPAYGEAQTPPAQSTGDPAQPRAAQASGVDSSRLGVSLDRIKRELAQAHTQSEPSQDGAMKLSFTVQVVGQAPKIDLLQGFSLNGPLMYGGPTHQEFLDVVTPQAYRSPVMPISAITYWAAQKLWQKTKKERCQEELASYKALVMSGVPVSAPTCTQ